VELDFGPSTATKVKDAPARRQRSQVCSITDKDLYGDER
jgi:hypothetical protein